MDLLVSPPRKFPTLFCFLAGTLVSLLSLAALAQSSPSSGTGATTGANPPSVRFTIVRKAFMPEKYEIVVDQSGDVKYQSWDKNDATDAYTNEFHASEETVTRIFDLAKATNYFQGSFDFTKHPVADQGAKTLTYASGAIQTTTKYNWSENQSIDELTHIFEGISEVLEFGQRIEFKGRFDPLGMDAELKSMQDRKSAGDLFEIQGAIGPLLQRVASDPAMMNIVRQDARKLLKPDEKK